MASNASNVVTSNSSMLSSITNINKPVSVILADPNHVRLNVESFTDSRTQVKSLANYVKVDNANITAAINRVQAEAARANYKQNLRANLMAF